MATMPRIILDKGHRMLDLITASRAFNTQRTGEPEMTHTEEKGENAMVTNL
jgi:hypothetical protein